MLADLGPNDRRILASEGHADLTIEVLTRRSESLYLSLAHYHSQADQLVPYPEMTVFVDFNGRHAEALTLLDGSRFESVYTVHSDQPAIEARIRRSLDRYLANWLCLLFIQDHQLPN